MTPAEARRFWAKVDRSAGLFECWPWLGATVGKGYGHFWLDGRMQKAHRVAFEAHLGRPMGADEQACHNCDNPPCCNPAHLFVGSASDNVSDMVAKDRHPAHMRQRAVCRRGHPMNGGNVLINADRSRRCRTCRDHRTDVLRRNALPSPLGRPVPSLAGRPSFPTHP